MWLIWWLVFSVGLAWGGGGGPTYTIIVPSNPDYEAMLDRWLMVQYCQHLARLGEPIPAGMTVVMVGDQHVCSGTPTQPAKLDYMHFAVGERLLRAEYYFWGAAEISDILRKNPDMDQNLRQTFPLMTDAERQVVRDAAPVQ